MIDDSITLPDLLQNRGRTPALLLGTQGLSAIGLNLTLGASAEQLVPDPAYIPDFAQWDRLTQDEARDENQATRRPLRNGSLSPGCQTYLERHRELSHSNEDGFRTVRRIQPPKGKQHARLGNAYEFFRCLESFTGFWDDPTQPPDMPPSPELQPSESETPTSSTPAATDTSSTPSSTAAASSTPKQSANEELEFKVVRTSAGSSMPQEYRSKLLYAFIKLVAYDFGCNVGMARTEPRLHVSQPAGSPSAPPRKTYFSSNCAFIHQAPTTRESARAGLVYGPVAAVSTRATTNFTTPDLETAQSQDLAKEIMAALITAQQRSRDGKTEVRFGQGQWWTEKPRWGGGSGGPIGREIDRDVVQGDKDTRPSDPEGMPAAKKPRKNMSIYDNYRMVRPPASTWDKKARYEAIGRQKGSDFDDIYVMSCLFHHFSILRVRVPARLLEVLDGAPEPATTENARRSWGAVHAWRSPWFDLFRVEDRLQAMKYLWGVMAYQMRQESFETDITMRDAQ